MTITVTAVNDAPTVTVAAGGTCGNDDHSGTINLTVGDVENAATTLTLSAASSNPALVPNGNVVFAGSGGCPHTDGKRRGRAHRHRDRDRHRQRWAGQRYGPVTVRAGGNGNDTLTGGTGADLILAQSNNDTLERRRRE